MPSGLNATLYTASVWPVSGWPTGWPVAASHSRTVLSALPEAMRLPSGLNATLFTLPCVAGQRLADGWPVPASHSRTVLSATAGGDALAVGAERHAVHRSRCGRSAAGRRVGRWPASHSRTVLSPLPEAIRVPSGLNATLYTAPVWPVSGCADGLAGVRVPHPHGAVATAGGDPGAVGAERHTVSPCPCGRSAARRRVGRCPRPTPAPCCRHCRRRCACRRG